MKTIVDFINETKNDSSTCAKTIKLLDALKEYYEEGSKGDKQSPFVKTFKGKIETFIKDCILDANWAEAIIEDIMNNYNIQCDSDDFDKCADEIIKYICK